MPLKYRCVAAVLAISAIAYWLQTQFFLESDVIYLAHAAEKLWQGGTYSQNFFETNPPLILYLYLPALFLKTSLNINLVSAVRLCFIVLTWMQIALISNLLKKFTMSREERNSILFGVILIDLFLPSCQFAQKEHFVLVFTLPYYFLAALRLNKKNISTVLAFFVGLMAVCGFGLKPFFLLPLGFIELYLVIKLRNIRTVLRTELVTIISLLGAYICCLFLFQPDYIHTVLPLVSHYYFASTAEPWQMIFDRAPSLYCLVVLALSPLIYRITQYKNLAAIVSLALAGFILAYVIPQASWYYHVLPALSLACLLIFLLVLEVKSYLLRFLLGCLLLAVPAYFAGLLYFSEFAIARNATMHKLISLANQPRAVKVYCIPTHQACSYLSAYTNVEYVSRFPSLWLLKGLTALPEDGHAIQDKKYLLAMVAEDMVAHHPDYIIINTQVKLGKLQSSIDYLAYFSENKLFQEEIRHYHLKASAGSYQIYSRIR
ncbi:MAG TPA: hypothetical protein VHA13_01260 [Gammaproteobacteria bacterium]|nr:hypothetical protein [Gammaproteobacteria bacterium]